MPSHYHNTLTMTFLFYTFGPPYRCRETYEALAKITVSSGWDEESNEWGREEVHEIPMTALEFGNAFLSARKGGKL